MTSVATTTAKPQPHSPAAATKSAPPIAADKNNSNQKPDAGRGIGQTLANVGGQALEIGKDVAQKSVSAITGQALSGVEHRARHAVRASVLNPMATLYSSMNVFLPFGVGKNLFSAVVGNFFLPYYQQINPHTKITCEQILHALEHGHTDSIENELFEAFDTFIHSNLKDDERAKYEAGDKSVVIKAFKNLAMSQITTAREPGGLKKICLGITKWIPLVNKLPTAVQPWIGGAAGVFIAYKVARIALYMVKKALWFAGGILGIKFLMNKFGGGATPPEMPSMTAIRDEEPSAEAGGFMSKLMKGAGKLAEVAAQAQGAGGHGAPGGGFGKALAALSGGGGGH